MKQKISGLLQQTLNANYLGNSSPKVGRLFKTEKIVGEIEEGGLASDTPPISYEMTVDQRVFGKVSRQLDAIWGSVIVTQGKPPHSLLLNASSMGEGVLLLAESLSLYLALEYGYKVVYVSTSGPGWGQKPTDTDLRYDALLEEVLAGKRKLASLIGPTNLANLYSLSIAHSESKLVQASLCQHPDIIREFLSETKNDYNIIIFDSQSVFASPWTVTMAKHMEVVLLVCSYANTRREVATNVLETFAAGGVNVLGAVLTDREFPVPAKLYRLIK